MLEDDKVLEGDGSLVCLVFPFSSWSHNVQHSMWSEKVTRWSRAVEMLRCGIATAPNPENPSIFKHMFSWVWIDISCLTSSTSLKRLFFLSFFKRDNKEEIFPDSNVKTFYCSLCSSAVDGGICTLDNPVFTVSHRLLCCICVLKASLLPCTVNMNVFKPSSVLLKPHLSSDVLVWPFHVLIGLLFILYSNPNVYILFSVLFVFTNKDLLEKY